MRRRAKRRDFSPLALEEKGNALIVYLEIGPRLALVVLSFPAAWILTAGLARAGGDLFRKFWAGFSGKGR